MKLNVAVALVVSVCFVGCGNGSNDNFEFTFQGLDSSWKGGDGCLSISLGPDRTLWLFGDSLITDPEVTDRSGAVIISNTIVLQTGDEFGFVWQEDMSGTPFEVFETDDADTWLWPVTGLTIGDKLYVVTREIEVAEGGLFTFQPVRDVIFEITNFMEPIENWEFTSYDVPGPSQFSSSLLLHETGGIEYVYIYGRSADWELILARNRVSDFLANPLSAREYYTGKGWSPDVDDLVGLFEDSSNGMTVYYDEKLAKYVAIYTETGLSDKILSRESDTPEGVWSEASLRFVCPEPGINENYFTYLARAHPQVDSDTLVVSYCTNSFQLVDLFTNLDLYYPQFIEIDLEQPGLDMMPTREFVNPREQTIGGIPALHATP